ncbi:MAG: 16S rRNA (cytidine(1402)-2'-O)-methyltransferase [Pseudomonadota bacterium]
MSRDASQLSAGLYLIATPLGTARDITLRALDILAEVDVLVAEDTRSLRKLMQIHGVPLADRPCFSYHDHNGTKVRPKILEHLEAGNSVAYASEAGTPMVADPGFDLARAVVEAGFALVSSPGPSAVITALTLSGLPTDQFFFAGFLPNAASKRKATLRGFRDIPGTLVFYESPKRLGAMLFDASDILGGDRRAAICRELTKKFEEIRRGTLSDLADYARQNPTKGEIVVTIDRAPSDETSQSEIDESLKEALQKMSVRDAADFVASHYNLKKRPVYQRALELTKG